MRISGLANVSTGSLPDAELAAIDRLFDPVLFKGALLQTTL